MPAKSTSYAAVMKERPPAGNIGGAHATFETKNSIFGEIGIKF
jgi:hypothetical protein